MNTPFFSKRTSNFWAEAESVLKYFEDFILKCSFKIRLLKHNCKYWCTFVVFHAQKPTGSINALYQEAATLAARKQ